MKHLLIGRSLRNSLALACLCFGLSALPTAQAQQAFSTMLYFNGVSPANQLVFGSNGNLYGPASGSGGGAPGGILYSIDRNGTQSTTIYQYGRRGIFTGLNPRGALLLGNDLNFYGTTYYRTAAPVTNAAVGAGTLFKISQDGATYIELKDFTDPLLFDAAGQPLNADGAYPQAGLIQGADGTLYGTTTSGGNGTGTIFKVAPDGSNFETLYLFDPIETVPGVNPTTQEPITVASTNADGRVINNTGAYPTTKLLLASDGDLYGVTSAGGINGTGTLFKIKVDSTGFTVLTTFDASPPLVRTNVSGAYPSSGLLQTPGGRLYGTTALLGANGVGNMYSVATDGSSFTVMHAFNIGDGASPSGDLIIGIDTMITGTTTSGGTLTPASGDTAAVFGSGTIYEISTDGATLNTLHVFTPSTLDGAAPLYGVVQDSDGNLYGTTSQGGAYSIGTVFKYGEATGITSPLGTPVYQGQGAFGNITIFALLALLTFSLLSKRRKLRSGSIC